MISIGHLDLNLTEHCNLSCLNCSHASPYSTPRFMSLEIIERDLAALKPFLKTHAINLVGGEPTLHKQIVEIMRLVKKIQIDVSTTFITNGTQLLRMQEDFWKELEYLSISIYPGLDPACIEKAKEMQRVYSFGMGLRESNEFHRQFRKEPNDGSHFASCHWKSDCYTVHEGFFYLCPQAAFFPSRFMGLQDGVDGLSLDGITEEKLAAYMHRTEPFNACRICIANEMYCAPWRQSSKRSEWLKESKSV